MAGNGSKATALVVFKRWLVVFGRLSQHAELPLACQTISTAGAERSPLPLPERCVLASSSTWPLLLLLHLLQLRPRSLAILNEGREKNRQRVLLTQRGDQWHAVLFRNKPTRGLSATRFAKSPAVGFQGPYQLLPRVAGETYTKAICSSLGGALESFHRVD